MRVVNGAPAERGTHPQRSREIELQDDFLVTSRDKSGVSTQASIHRVKLTYIVKPLRACSRCMVGDRKRRSERRCGRQLTKWPSKLARNVVCDGLGTKPATFADLVREREPRVGYPVARSLLRPERVWWWEKSLEMATSTRECQKPAGLFASKPPHVFLPPFQAV
jgi:hypothetical protein